MEEREDHAEVLARHKKETLIQIVLPVAVVGILVLAGVIWMAVATVDQGFDTSNAGSIATIWVILPVIFLAVVFAALCIGLTCLVIKGKIYISKYLNIGNLYIQLANIKITNATNKAANAQIEVESKLASIKTIANKFRNPGMIWKPRGENIE